MFANNYQSYYTKFARTIIGRWSLMYRPRCSRHVLLTEPVRRIFSFFRPAKPRGEQAIYTIKIMDRHSPYTALLIFNKRLCTLIIRFRFSAQGGYLLLVPQGRALIPFFSRNNRMFKTKLKYGVY